MLDIESIRSDFPILSARVHGRPLAYLDNAATTQKPKAVTGRTIQFYNEMNGNVHRGSHYLSDRASRAYEEARERVRSFLNAGSASEIVFTGGTTDAINLVAASFADRFLGEGDEILVTEMEHHSNLVPWQRVCEKKGAKLRFLPVTDDGALLLDSLEESITPRTKLVSVIYVSNALGMINPVKEIIGAAKSRGVPVLLDAAQAVQHMPVDVTDLDCDFLAFSGHKIFAETGIGVLYGKKKWLEELPPYRTGGGMVASVTLEKTDFLDPPLKFEAGTTNIAAAVSLGAAIEYVEALGLAKIVDYEKTLLKHALERLESVPGAKVYGNDVPRCGLVSFNMDDVHPYDVGMVLDKLGIAVRTGTHCAEPLMRRFGITGTVRASFAFYNTEEEIDRLVNGLERAWKLLRAG